jgi:hypothetical protein
MADEWLPYVEAASRLQMSTRTLQRRIANGRYQTRRRTDDGRVEVLVSDVTPPPSDGQVSADLSDRQIQLAGGAVAAWRQLADTSELRITEVRGDLKRSRRWAGLAWAVVVVLAGGLAVGGWWEAQQRGQLELAQAAQLAQTEKSEDLAARLTEAQQEATEAQERASVAAQAEAQARTELNRLEGEVAGLQAAVQQAQQQRAAGGLTTWLSPLLPSTGPMVEAAADPGEGG